LLREFERRAADEAPWQAFSAMKKESTYRIRNWSEYAE